MVNNPQWVQQQSQWSKTIANWIETGHGDAMMNLAIVLDAHAIAGNKSLLRRLRKDLMAQMANRSVTLAFFAQPALKFHTPLTLFGNIKSKQAGLDIKKGGIFPIVHGIRALALEQGISPTNTLERIEQLAKLKVLDEDTSANLTEALLLFFKLRIQQLFPAQQQQDYHVLKVDQLNHSQRDLLRHGLHVVKKFKQLLALHFNIRDY
jgi:CBS domain-containing protein